LKTDGATSYSRAGAETLAPPFDGHPGRGPLGVAEHRLAAGFFAVGPGTAQAGLGARDQNVALERATAAKIFIVILPAAVPTPCVRSQRIFVPAIEWKRRRSGSGKVGRG